MREPQYEIAMALASGERASWPATRLPRSDETIEDWIDSEIAILDEETAPARGLIWVDRDAVQAITFVKFRPQTTRPEEEGSERKNPHSS